jgi:hypothetical protein
MSEFMRVTGVTLLQMSFEVVPALTVGHPNVSISTYVVDNVVEPGQGHSPSLEAIRLELHHCAIGLLLGEDRLQVYVARVYMEPPPQRNSKYINRLHAATIAMASLLVDDRPATGCSG